MTALAYSWTCLGPATVPPQPCDAHGIGAGSDKAAERHVKASGHSTMTSCKEGC
mgnify:CR=1 FL=1